MYQIIKKNFKPQSNEILFVVLCACNEPNKARINKIIEMASMITLNWDYIIEISLKQRVLPLIYKNIKLFLSDTIPGKPFKRMMDLNFDNSTRNLYLFSFLLRILHLFDKNNISVIPFKGPILAQDAYRDIGLRLFSDLDILVKESDALKAWGLLLKNNYQPQLKLKNDQKQQYIKAEDHMAFSKNTVCIELHWEMSGIYLSYPLLYEHMAIRIRKITIDNRIIPNLSSEDLLIYLCVHGTKHGWSHLEQICCVAEVIKSNKTIDWQMVERLAIERQCKKILWLGLYLSWYFYKVTIPNPLMNKIKCSDSISKFANEVTICLFSESASSKGKSMSDRFSSFHIRIRDSFIDKIRYILRLIFRATDKEWLYFPVPASLSFIHYILRPCRLLITRLRGKYA